MTTAKISPYDYFQTKMAPLMPMHLSRFEQGTPMNNYSKEAAVFKRKYTMGKNCRGLGGCYQLVVTNK